MCMKINTDVSVCACVYVHMSPSSARPPGAGSSITPVTVSTPSARSWFLNTILSQEEPGPLEKLVGSRAGLGKNKVIL